jgi:selenocysteine-specific elongation factor
LKDQARVRVHVASAELLARARILGGATAIESGGVGLAQLRFERPAVAGHGDRLILRSYSPITTIGGAVVLDPLSPKRRSRDPQTLERVAALGTQDPAEAAALMVAAGGTQGVGASVLAARITRPLSWLADALSKDRSILRLGQEPSAFLARSAADELARRVRSRLEQFHQSQPLKATMSREELRRRVFGRAPAGAFEHVLSALAAAGEVKLVDQGVALGRHAVTLSPEEQSARQTLLAAALESGLEGLDLRRAAGTSGKDLKLLERISRVLLGEDLLRRVGEDLLIHADALDTLVKRVRERWPAGSRLDVAAIKQLTGLSRKYVIPLLEYLDRMKVTRRAGNDRVVLP